MKRISKKYQLAIDALSNKPHITRDSGKWVCHWSGNLDLCMNAEQFARDLNRKRHKTYTHK